MPIEIMPTKAPAHKLQSGPCYKGYKDNIVRLGVGRARRRRRNYTVDEARERPLVPLERALNELTSWSGAEDDNDKAGE